MNDHEQFDYIARRQSEDPYWAEHEFQLRARALELAADPRTGRSEGLIVSQMDMPRVYAQVMHPRPSSEVTLRERRIFVHPAIHGYERVLMIEEQLR